MYYEYVVMIFPNDDSIDSKEFDTREAAINFIENELKAETKKNAIDVWETELAEIVLERGY